MCGYGKVWGYGEVWGEVRGEVGESVLRWVRGDVGRGVGGRVGKCVWGVGEVWGSALGCKER